MARLLKKRTLSTGKILKCLCNYCQPPHVEEVLFASVDLWLSAEELLPTC